MTHHEQDWFWLIVAIAAVTVLVYVITGCEMLDNKQSRVIKAESVCEITYEDVTMRCVVSGTNDMEEGASTSKVDQPRIMR